MNIKWIPQRSDNKISYKKKNDNILLINNEEVSFEDTSIVEFDIPEELSYSIKKAYRKDDELYLDLIRPYTEEEKNIWEDPDYYLDGGYRGSKYEEYNKNGALV